VEPLKTVASNFPLVAIAAQITWPEPSLVQLGFEATAPTRLVHVPQELPLSSLTIIALFPLRTAHTALPLETKAQEGLPTPVALPVEVKFPQEAQAEGQDASPKHISRYIAVRFISFFLVVENGGFSCPCRPSPVTAFVVSI
jgi:hypothetical protein